MGLTLVTDAASLAVTLADISPELDSYEQSTANDAIVTAKLYEAIDYIQSQTQRQFIQATWKQTLDNWPARNRINIDLQPLSSVSSVKYYDADGTLQTVSTSDYWTDTNSKPPRIVFKSTFTWPTVELDRPGAIEITFVAGYASASVVPRMAKLAIKMLATYWYEQRHAVVTSSAAAPTATTPAVGEIPYGVTQIINMLRADGYT
jgi:uncharacterized phiE125 gp8 family phage protein